jgi:CspA family cold shock protein
MNMFQIKNVSIHKYTDGRSSRGKDGMATGTVKWFNNQKGYGFICSTTDNNEIFAHFTSIVMEGYRSLKAGQQVDFDISEGPKGLHAMNIRLQEANNKS